MPSHLLVRQHHDVACRGRAALPRIPHSEPPTTLPSSLRNIAETVGHPMAQRTPSSPMNDEFMGMTEYVMESFHNLPMEETESHSTSDSSRGSHHASRECFMVGTPEEHVESIHEEATQTNDLNDEVDGEIGAHPACGWSS